MIVSHPARVLFVHVQKTGGSTIAAILRDRLPGAEPVSGLPGAKHALWDTALQAYPEFDGYWTFGFVRNPWARMWSWYAMIERRREAAQQGHERAGTRLGRNAFWSGVLRELPDFEAFVLRGPDLFERLRVPQLSYLEARGRRADFIGRTESFASDLAAACARLGIELPEAPPRGNAGPSSDYRTQYTPEMRRRVAQLFAPDIREFGYDFDRR